MLPVLQIGPLAVQTPMLLLLLGLWTGLSIGARYASRLKCDSKTLDDLVLISILAGLLGARLLYVIRYPAAFLDNPTSILSLNPGLFLPSGGLLVAGVAFLILLQRKNLELWSTLDGLTLPISIFLVFLGFSHLASGSFYGLPSDLPWAVQLWGVSRHPTQIYEIILAGMILWYVWKKFKVFDSNVTSSYLAGSLFLEFTSLTAIVWIFLATFQADPPLLFFNIRTIQLISVIFLFGSFWLLREKSSKHKVELK